MSNGRPPPNPPPNPSPHRSQPVELTGALNLTLVTPTGPDAPLTQRHFEQLLTLLTGFIDLRVTLGQLPRIEAKLDAVVKKLVIDPAELEALRIQLDAATASLQAAVDAQK